MLDVDGWDLSNYQRNGIVGYQHDVYGGDNTNPDSVIGIGTAEVRGDKLIGKVTFEPEDINPLAEKIFRKVQFGTLKATSVGFNPLEEGEWREVREGEGEVYHYGKRDLLEWSIVNIPSNPSATRSIEEKEKENLTFEKKPAFELEGEVKEIDSENDENSENTLDKLSLMSKRLDLLERESQE